MEKLVRDKIPEIIEQKGEIVDYYTAANDEVYCRMLSAKLHEEALELTECRNAAEAKEEAADVLEVLEALYVYWGFSEKDVLELKADKKHKRGGFSKKYILKL